MQYRSENLVLETLQRTALHQCLGVGGNAIALIDLYGEFNGGDGGQPCMTENGSDAEIVVAYDGGNHVFQFLLQHVERCRRLFHLTSSI